MKKIKIIILTLLFSSSFILSNAQCYKFTVNEVAPLLDDFILNGRYISLPMTEGEQILICKTISKGFTYRFIVKSKPELPDAVIRITEWNGEEIYNNKNHNLNQIFDYENKETQKVKIYVRIPKKNKVSKNGCLSLILGLKISG